MKYLSFILFVYSLTTLVYAGPDDKWVYIGSQSGGLQFDGIALLLAVGTFAWVYVIYRDLRGRKK